MRYRLLIAVGLLCALSARAGVLIVEKTEHFGRTGLSSTSRVLLDHDRVRVESKGSQNESTFIYLASTETMYIINSKEGSYMELTRAQIEAMMNQVARMKAMMDEKLKGLPPEQRRMMEKMMKGRMGGAQGPPAKTVYRKVGSGETVGQWSCDKYEGYRQNEKVSEIWTTDWSDFGIKPEDFAVFRSLAKMFEGLAKQMKIDMYQVGAINPQSEHEFAGLPVRRIMYRNGKPYAKHEVLEVTRKDFDDSLFQVPAGLKKKEMPNMGKLPQAKSQPAPAASTTSAG